MKKILNYFLWKMFANIGNVTKIHWFNREAWKIAQKYFRKYGIFPADTLY